MCYSHLTMPSASVQLGMRESMSAPSVRSPRNRSEPFDYSSIAKDAFVTVRCSIWPSTVSFAATTWSRSGSVTWSPLKFDITRDVRASMLAWLERRRGTVEDYAFPSRIDHAHCMSTRQYARLVDESVTAFGLRQQEYRSLAPSHEGVHNLLGYGQHPRHRDPARSLQD